MTNAGEPVDIPDTLCARDMPHLRRLTFETSRYIRVPLWLLSGITHFTTSASVSLHELIDTLQAMPQLEELCIMRFLYDYEPGQVPLGRVALPCLSLLTVRNKSPHLFVVLSTHIDEAPPSTLRRTPSAPSLPDWSRTSQPCSRSSRATRHRAPTMAACAPHR